MAEGLGNLLSRVLALGEKYHSPILLEKNELLDFRQKIEKQYQQKMQEFKFNEALASVWDLVNALNKYLTDKKPWKTITNNPKEFEEQLATLVLSLGEVALLIAPVMPETSEKILEALQLKNLTETNWHNLKVSLKTGIPLFPKL